MIHTNRIVTVGEQECIIDRPIVLYRGDREVEIEFTLVGNEFMFSEEGNVIKSVNASHGQLVLNTPSGEHMFSELAECHEGKVIFVVTKEMIDEFIEMGFYSFQIRLYDSAEMKSRVTIPPVMNGFDIRNPIAAEDETNVVDQGIVDYARIFKDQSNEELPTFDWTGAYNKTEWVHHDVITENKMNKIEDALYSINANVKESDVHMLNALDNVKKDADKYVKEHMAEVEADVEDFERNLNADVQQFKIDTNAAMTAHKNEVSEELESVNSQLAHNETELKLLKNANNVYGINIPEYSDIGLILNDIIQNTNVPVIYIPSGTYNSSVEITIDRPVKIIGENSWYTEDETGVQSIMPYISFASSKGFNITVPNVRIENISVRAVDYGFFAEYHNYDGRIRSIYNIQLENCTSEHCREADFYIGMTVQCEIKHCVALGGKTGFRFEGGQNTSTLIENCWARNVQEEGYYCAAMTYCTFINCCCDIGKTGFVVSNCKSVNFIGCGSELVEDVFHLSSCIGVTIIEPFGAFNGGTESNPLNEKGSLINAWYSKDITITGGNNIEYNGNYDITCHGMIDGDVPILLGGSDLRVNFFKANNAIKQGGLLKYMSIEGGAGDKSYYVPSAYAKYKVIYTIFVNGTVEQTISTTMDGGSLVFNLPVSRTCQIIYIPLA